jgi:hypothetical protein
MVFLTEQERAAYKSGLASELTEWASARIKRFTGYEIYLKAPRACGDYDLWIKKEGKDVLMMGGVCVEELETVLHSMIAFAVALNGNKKDMPEYCL